MANLIDEIVSQKAFDELERLKRELAEAQKSIEAFYKQTGSMPKFGGAGTATSELEKMVALTKRLTEQIEVYGSVAGKALVEAQQAKRELVNETKLLVQQEQAEEGSINQLRASLNLLTKQYETMGKAAREGLGGKDLHARIMATRTEVDKLEQSLGNYKRNVGNYTNATFQLSQVFRELPAFTFSATTGIMALSNNLPMLADSFKQVSQATNETTGKVNGTMGALKIFGASIFSLGNIFTLAIAAFTIFSDQIVKLFTNTKAVNKELDDLAETIGKDIAQSKMLIEIIENTNISMDKRIVAAKKLIAIYPETLKNYKAEEIAAGKASGAIDKITNSIIAYAKVKAIQNQIEKYAADQFSNEQQIAIAQRNLIRAEKNLEIQKQSLALMTPTNKLYDSQVNAVNDAQKEVDRLNQRIKEGKDANLEYENGIKNLAQVASNLLPKILDETPPKKAKKEKEKKEKKEKEPFKPEFRFDDNDYENIKKYYDELKKATEEIFKEVEPFIRERGEAVVKDRMESLVMPVLDIQAADALNAQLMNRAKQNKQNLTDQKKSAEELKQLFSAIENLANSITQSLTTINDIINQRINAEFDAREKKMNAYYDQEEGRIKRSMVSGTAKEEALMKLQAQREMQQKKIDIERTQAERKSAQRQKAIDILGIISNTALAITKALTDSVPPAVRYINAIASGAIGSAQLAAVIAAPLPEFAKGTESSPEGYAVVGEKGHELVIEPSGKKWVTPAKDTITYLRKGSKVIPNDKLMTMVRDSAYVELANMNMPVTPDLYGKALVDQFDELANKVDKLSAVMSNKDMRVNIVGNFDHYMHVKRNIK